LLSATESYGCSFFPLKLFMLKLLGKKENRRLFLRFSDEFSEFLRKNWKLLLRLSVEVLGAASSLVLGIAFRMLTGGCLRSLFSGCTMPSCACSERLRELLRPSMRSVMLPSVELRL